MRFPFFPQQASTIAPRVDALYFYLTGVCGFVLLLILLVMVYFLIKYRQGKQVDRRPKDLPTHFMETAWILIPLGFFMSFFAWGGVVFYDMQRVPPGALELNVIGKQWMWYVYHPGGNREINELHVPRGRVVKLTMISQDVIHSFYLPAFRVKQDVLPSRYTTMWFQATRAGVYPLFCAEYCGKDHSDMVGRVVVLDPADYEVWLTRGDPMTSLVQAGADLFRDLGCSGCHVRSTVVNAPPLEGLYGKPVPLASGEIVIADEMYIHDSIVFPERHIAAGYPPVMPSYRGFLSEEQLLKLVTYIKSLADAEPATQLQPPTR